MKTVLFALSILSVIWTGCSRNCGDTSLYQRTGQIKPIVSVMPVINATGQPLAVWDTSREFTDEIRKKVFDSSKLYLLREPGSMELAQELNIPNPMEIPMDLKSRMGPAEYVIIAELIDQHQTPYQMGARDEAGGAVLYLAMRVRVIDLHKDKPSVILQEIIDHEQVIAKPYLNIDYNKISWGTEAYESTPLGMAHQKVVRELVAHVENYIIAAR
ncbi:MAG: hypothetical protein JSS62_06770 [Verrucomicrobia bacterium]|nr:hypothetical protein [Verrucomicrobiota bacterium]MBS0645892.1 hypothetical protein [Verrucomicrobiota bacterium]